MNVFNRRTVRAHRDRAAAHFQDYDFLFAETADRLADRLEDITRDFPITLELGCHGGELARVLQGRGRIQTLIQSDLSPAMARRAAGAGEWALAADEEALPFHEKTFDAVLSNLSLHWVNDLPGALLQIRRCLKPDGLLLVSMLGGETLKELRDCLAEAEISREDGLSPRVSPFADVRDVGSLLQRAGFALPVVDSEEITVSYASPLKLMADLRGMGESNAVELRRKTVMRRDTLMTAATLYQEKYGDADGRVPATFQVLTLTGWSPHESQQKPLRPGSAKTRLADALDSEEISLGEKATPGS